MSHTITREKIELLFAEAVKDADREKLGQLLHETGEYQIQDEQLDHVDVDKQQFIKWIISKRNDTTSLEYYTDQCMLCQTGNPVLIFNDGYFPARPKDNSYSSKTGLMLNISDGRIDTIMFCFTFLNTINRPHYEVLAECMKECMSERGCTLDEAIDMVIRQDKDGTLPISNGS
jgi:hypothetical protein